MMIESLGEPVTFVEVGGRRWDVFFQNTWPKVFLVEHGKSALLPSKDELNLFDRKQASQFLQRTCISVGGWGVDVPHRGELAKAALLAAKSHFKSNVWPELVSQANEKGSFCLLGQEHRVRRGAAVWLEFKEKHRYGKMASNSLRPARDGEEAMQDGNVIDVSHLTDDEVESMNWAFESLEDRVPFDKPNIPYFYAHREKARFEADWFFMGPDEVERLLVGYAVFALGGN